MKVALLVAIVALAGIADATPSHEHPLEDAAHVVPDSDEPDLEAQLRALQADAGVALGVVVIRTTGNQTIESYARAHREEWSRGTERAALFVLAVDDRRSRLEVNDALRDRFPDSRAQAILDNLKGYLRSSDYSAAIRAMIREVRQGATGVAPDLESPHPQSPDVAPTYTPRYPETHYPDTHYPDTPGTTDEEPHSNVAVLLAVLFGVALFVLIAFMWARSRIASRATVSSHGVHVGASVLVETLVCMGLIVGGIFYVALMVLAASAGDSDSSSSSNSSWGSSDSSGSSGSSGSSSSGGWSGGGASSSW